MPDRGCRGWVPFGMTGCDRDELRAGQRGRARRHRTPVGAATSCRRSSRRPARCSTPSTPRSACPDDDGEFAQFVADGVSDEQWRAIGPLPRQHGILGAMLHEPSPVRLADVRADPRFGWLAGAPTRC